VPGPFVPVEHVAAQLRHAAVWVAEHLRARRTGDNLLRKQNAIEQSFLQYPAPSCLVEFYVRTQLLEHLLLFFCEMRERTKLQ